MSRAGGMASSDSSESLAVRYPVETLPDDAGRSPQLVATSLLRGLDFPRDAAGYGRHPNRESGCHARAYRFLGQERFHHAREVRYLSLERRLRS